RASLNCDFDDAYAFTLPFLLPPPDNGACLSLLTSCPPAHLCPSITTECLLLHSAGCWPTRLALLVCPCLYDEGDHIRLLRGLHQLGPAVGSARPFGC